MSLDTLVRRACYGGRKGRAAKRRLSGLVVHWVHPRGGSVSFSFPHIPVTREPLRVMYALGNMS